jgi:mannobiose 2-epimerase
MVGFYNAWQISGDDKYLELSVNSWQFVKDKILDSVNGEWFWGTSQYGHVLRSEDKVGIWKCPYHNSRACLEIIKRIG